MGAGEGLAGNLHAPGAVAADGVDDGVMAGGQLRGGDVSAELDRAEEAQARVLGDALIDRDDGFDLLVVRGHPAAHQAVGRGQAVEEVDADFKAGGLEQGLGGIEARGSGSDDGDDERALGGSEVVHGEGSLLQNCQ